MKVVALVLTVLAVLVIVATFVFAYAAVWTSGDLSARCLNSMQASMFLAIVTGGAAGFAWIEVKS